MARVTIEDANGVIEMETDLVEIVDTSDESNEWIDDRIRTTRGNFVRMITIRNPRSRIRLRNPNEG